MLILKLTSPKIINQLDIHFHFHLQKKYRGNSHFNSNKIIPLRSKLFQFAIVTINLNKR